MPLAPISTERKYRPIIWSGESRLLLLTERLMSEYLETGQRKYADAQVEKILGGNALRCLRRAGWRTEHPLPLSADSARSPRRGAGSGGYLCLSLETQQVLTNMALNPSDRSISVQGELSCLIGKSIDQSGSWWTSASNSFCKQDRS